MAKKKPAEEHENLERWLVSYADFMTLLFATFVVLYALAQSDVNSFKGIEEALRKAFSQSIFSDNTNIMDGQDSILEGNQGAMNPLMLEYMSTKYEQSSYDEIKDEIENLKQDGVSAEIDDRGLVIRLNSHAIQFAAGGADLSQKSYDILNAVAKIIKEKFSIHYIQVEGHTDSDPISNPKYPSNWELSSARASSIVRHLINNYNFSPSIFIASGYADTVPVAQGNSQSAKQKNRRVEIVILKNKYRYVDSKNMDTLKSLGGKKNATVSEAARKLTGEDEKLLENVIDFKQVYKNETKRIDQINEGSNINKMLQKPDFLE